MSLLALVGLIVVLGLAVVGAAWLDERRRRAARRAWSRRREARSWQQILAEDLGGDDDGELQRAWHELAALFDLDPGLLRGDDDLVELARVLPRFGFEGALDDVEFEFGDDLRDARGPIQSCGDLVRAIAAARRARRSAATTAFDAP